MHTRARYVCTTLRPAVGSHAARLGDRPAHLAQAFQAQPADFGYAFDAPAVTVAMGRNVIFLHAGRSFSL
jgi:hypothetical protein